MAFRDWLVALAISGSALTALPAWAEEKGESGDAAAAESDSSSDGETAKGDEGADKAPEKGKKEGDAAPAEPAASDTSPVELPGKTYRFVGLRYRLILVPKFMMGLFADGGTTVAVHSFGGEFGIRKDNFEYNLGLWYAGYGMEPTPFKAKSDGEDAWELVESNLKVLYLTADFLWSQPISPEVAFNYGMSAGLGLVFGNLYRNQAYKQGDEYLPCTAPGVPNPAYCGRDNDHYGNYEEPGWGDGGSKPAIFPWIALQTGLRYKPHKNFVGRLDVGFGLSGFFFGLGADYGI